MSRKGESQALLGSVQGKGGAQYTVLPPLIYSLIVALGPLSFGYTLGYTSPIKDDLEQHSPTGIGISSSENSLFGSLVNVGAMVGSIASGILLDRIGRNKTIFCSSVLFVAGFLTIAFSHSFGVLLLGRLLCGLAVGLISVAVPVYIAEISPTPLRGGLGSINQLGVTIGILVVYSIGLGVKWRPLAWIGAIAPGALAIASFLIPATPRSLVSAGKRDEAIRSLKRLRGAHIDVMPELEEIEYAIALDAQKPAGSVGDLFKGGAKKAMFIAVCLMLFQQFSGINSVIFFSGQIFDDAGFHDANTAALIVSGVQVIVTAISCVLVDKSGRRSLLMAAGIGMTASLAVLGYFFFLQNSGHPTTGTVALVSVLLYIACFSLGLGAIPWLMMSEIFPATVRGTASSAATLLNWSCSFLVTETFKSMISGITEEGVFWFYGSVCVLGVLFVLFKVPETKGRSLEELERYFEGNTSNSGQERDGPGTGGDLVKIACLLALLFVGFSVLGSSIH